ncbi:MAG: PD-(D/E)XK nuclease family protein [Saccharofermentanales bacterium]|jgi:ATP-dependent helicase/nuclease subunit B
MATSRVQLLYATDPDDLVRRMFEALTTREIAWPDRRAFLIVPEFQKADIERRYLRQEDAGGLMMTEVVSFRRLATRLFAEAGEPIASTISRAGKAALIQKALMDPALHFRQFDRMAGRPGYLAEWVNIIGDFRRYDVTADTLQTIASEGLERLARADRPSAADEARRATFDKLADFSLLMRSLDRDLERRDVLDPDMILDRLARFLEDPDVDRKLPYLRKSSIWVLGFGGERNLTSQEMRVLDALARRAASLTVGVTADAPRDVRDAVHPAFAHGRTTLTALQRRLPGAVTVPVPSDAAGVDGVLPLRAVPKATRLVRAINEREEASYVAGEIRRLLMTDPELRRRDIGIALCDPAEATPRIQAALELYGVDAFIDARTPLIETSVMRRFVALLRLSRSGFTLDDFMNFLRADGLPVEADAIDDFENTALALGWRHDGDLRKAIRTRDDLDDVIDEDGIRARVTTVLEATERLFYVIDALQRAPNGRAKCDRLLDLCLEPGPLGTSWLQRTEARRDRLMEHGSSDAAVTLVAAWNALIDFLVEAGDLLDFELPHRSFVRIMTAAILDLRRSTIPIGADRVRVGSLSQMALWPCRVLFIVGALPHAFPPDFGHEGFLNDDERAWLRHATDQPFPNRRQDAPTTQSWLVEMLTRRPSDGLYISVPTLGDDTAPVMDALMNDPARAGTVTVTMVDAPDRRPDVRWYAPEPARRLVRWNPHAPAAWRQAVRELATRPTEAPPPAWELADDWQVPAERAYDHMAARNTVSVSLLQTYATCPMLCFFDRMLNARERRVAEDRANRQGTLLHGMLEVATHRLLEALDGNEDPATVRRVMDTWADHLQRPAVMRAIYEQAARQDDIPWYNFPDISGGVGVQLRTSVANTLLVLHEAYRRLGVPILPWGAEWRFPSRTAPSGEILTLDMEGGRAIPLKGFVDRIDVGADHAVRILDYKRKEKAFSWMNLYYGTDIQLPIYKLAFEKAFPDRHVTGVHFIDIKNPHTSDATAFRKRQASVFDETVRQMTSSLGYWQETYAASHRTKAGELKNDLELASTYALDRAQRTLDAMLEGRFNAGTINDAPCQYCAWRAVCGYDNRIQPYRKPRDVERFAWRQGADKVAEYVQKNITADRRDVEDSNASDGG